MAAGLLILVSPFFLGIYMSVPDYQRGLIAGIGLGLEMLALRNIRRSRA